MANPATVVKGYARGMRRDEPRQELPPDAAYNIVDLIPSVLGAPARKRGGWANASAAISAITAGSATSIESGIVAEFTAGQSIILFDEDGRAYEAESTTGTEDIGAALVTRNPIFYDDKIIVPHAAGTTAPKKITRSGGTHTISNLGGSPPAGRYAVIHKDVVWLASPAASSDYIFFSLAGQPESWDTTVKWMRASYPITGMAALANAVFVFSLNRTMRVRGSIPPPDDDFIVDDPIFEVGCTDNRSIALYRDKVIWANAQGLYISDGTAMEDMTKICGMKAWWRGVMRGEQGFATGTPYNLAGFTIAGGIYGDYYVYSILNGTTIVDAGLIDLTKFAWHRISNLDAACFFPRLYPEELFFGRRQEARAGAFSPVFVPAASNKADGDGAAVTWELETPYFMGEPGIKTLRRAYVSYDMRDADTDNPTLTVSYVDTPEETSYTALSPVLGETSEYHRVHLPLNFPAPGIAFKLVQAEASSDTRLYAVELEAIGRERSR